MASKPMVPPFGQPTIHSQLISNQIWEAVAMMAKAAFLFLLTPLMLRVWGQAGYGAFAVASSTVVVASMFDLGLRGHTRVELCRAVALSDRVEAGHIMARGVGQSIVVAFLVLILTAGFSALNLWSHLLSLPPGQEHLVIMTILLTELYMLSGFFLEPLIAEGRIGLTKLSSAVGALSAIPAVWLVLERGGSVTHAVTAWLGCLIFGNILLPFLTGHLRHALIWEWRALWLGKKNATLFAGIWFNVSNVAWLAKNHGLTFLVSALLGPATAGTFFILLRLSEVIGSFGGISSDVVLGGISAGDLPHRRKILATAYMVATVLFLTLGLGAGFLAPTFWTLWLKTPPPLGWATGWLVALLGISAGLNRMIVNSAMGLGIRQKAAAWSVVEVIFVITGVGLAYRFGLGNVLLIASAAIICLTPVAWEVSRALGQSFWKTWLPRWNPTAFVKGFGEARD